MVHDRSTLLNKAFGCASMSRTLKAKPCWDAGAVRRRVRAVSKRQHRGKRFQPSSRANARGALLSRMRHYRADAGVRCGAPTHTAATALELASTVFHRLSCVLETRVRTRITSSDFRHSLEHGLRENQSVGDAVRVIAHNI